MAELEISRWRMITLRQFLLILEVDNYGPRAILII